MDRSVFFFNDTATTEIYTLSLHDALPISAPYSLMRRQAGRQPSPGATIAGQMPQSLEHDQRRPEPRPANTRGDRKSTRLNSSHANISYAVFCLKKKNTTSSCVSLRVRAYS